MIDHPQLGNLDVLPKRSAPELIDALRQRAALLTGEKWERTATAAMMNEAADLLASLAPPKDYIADELCSKCGVVLPCKAHALPHPPQEPKTLLGDIRGFLNSIEWTTNTAAEQAEDFIQAIDELDRLAASPPAQEQEPHRDCHDLVCNGSRQYPRGETGHGCSCRGRDLRNAAAPPAQGWQPPLTDQLIGELHAMSREDLLEWIADRYRAAAAPHGAQP